MNEAKERLIFALDVDSSEDAERFTELLTDYVGMFKIGPRLFLPLGSKAVEMVTGRGGKVFLDLKFHDIPETVATSAIEAAKLGIHMLTLHALGGYQMMRRTAERLGEFCYKKGLRRPLLITVTILTSLGVDEIKEMGFTQDLSSEVKRLALLAKKAHMDGAVSSPREISLIKEDCGQDFLVVTPGIRGAICSKSYTVSQEPMYGVRHMAYDDQRRTMGALEAISSGSDFIVVGRPIRDSADPLAMTKKIIEEIEEGLRRKDAPKDL